MWRLNAYNYKKDETKFQMTPTITWITAVHVTRDCPLCDLYVTVILVPRCDTLFARTTTLDTVEVPQQLQVKLA